MKAYIRYLAVCLFSLALFVFIGCSDNGDGDDTVSLTVDNVQGTYVLDIEDSTIIDFDDDDVQEVSGTLVIDDITFSFTLTATSTDRGTLTLIVSTVTITSDDGEVSTAEVALSDNGNTLTIIDAAGDQEVWIRRDGSGTSDDLTLENIQGAYDLDLNRSTGLDFELFGFSSISGELVITDTTFEVTATAQAESIETFVIDGDTIELSDDDGEISRLTATLSETTLTLVGEDGDQLVFERR